MCGRYASSRRPEDLVELFEVDEWDPTEALAPDWNVAPTKPVWAVLERPPKDGGASPGDGGPPHAVRRLRVVRWGLVPSWAKSPEIGSRMINARAETVHEKPAFRRAFAARRCLLPADGFYEWQAPEPGAGGRAAGQGAAAGRSRGRPGKQPFFITPEDGSVLAMAGLYEWWRDPTRPQGDPRAWLCSCTVLTTDPRDSLGRIHPRMPLLVRPDRYGAWLDPGRSDPAELRALLEAAVPGELRAHPVSTAVNNVRNNGPELVEPVPAAETLTDGASS